MKLEIPNDTLLTNYMKPMWQWIGAIQNDFAARADWCVKSFKEANHPPVVHLKNALDISAKPGNKIMLNATGTYDPDGNNLSYKWWQYEEAGYLSTAKLKLQIQI